MRYLSVCSGIEAASVAWEPLGWEPAAFSEIDAFPSAVLKHHYPTVPNLGDLRRFKRWPHETVDLLVGGTPCQSFSVAGLRKGMDDPRGNLALVFLALLDRVRPRWVVWENVPGVLSSSGGRDFGAFIGGLGQLGYHGAYRILDAQYFGVPQRRRRVFVVGHLGDWRRAAAVLFERESLSGNPPPRRGPRQDVTGTISSRPRGSGVFGTDFDIGGGVVAGTLPASGAGTERPAGQANELDFCVPVAPTLRGGSHGGKSHGKPSGSDQMPLVALALKAKGQYMDGTAETYVTGTLNAGGKAAGSATQQDAESGLLVAHPLRGDGFDASEDGTGRGTPIIIQDARGMDKGQNGLGITEDGPAYTLDQLGSQAVAFPGNLSGTQRLKAEEVSPSLGAKNPNAVAFESRFARNGRGGPSEVVPPLKAESGKDGRGDGSPLVFQQNSRSEVRLIGGDGESAGAVTSGPGAQCQNYMKAGMTVRRLTPRECERLQGFPDDYTLVKYRGNLAADGPRYKALGNSMAVPVMRWIGRRIIFVEGILDDHRLIHRTILGGK